MKSPHKLIPNRIAGQVERYFHQQQAERPHIFLLSLATADGFPLAQVRSSSHPEIPGDKVGAISSSLCSMGASASKVLLGGGLNITILETDVGHTIFLSVTIAGKPAVLTVCADMGNSLAEVRYHAIRIRQHLGSLVVEG